MFAAFDVTAITKALLEAEAFITAKVKSETGMVPKGRMQWVATNENQVQLMRRFQAVQKDLPRLPELQAWAKETAEELNAILEEHGFSIRLDPWQKSPDKFGVVAIYDITIEWLVEGAVTNSAKEPYIIPGNGKPAFRLDGEKNEIWFYELKDRVVIKIPGKRRGDFLCLTKASGALEQFTLLKEVESLRKQMTIDELVMSYGGAVLPNIVFDTKDTLKIDWLIGLHATDAAGSPWVVKQAKMQAKFALGRKGARGKVAVALQFERMAISMHTPPPDYVVNHDVIIWMERDGVSEPYFVAYVTMNDFADHQVELNEID